MTARYRGAMRAMILFALAVAAPAQALTPAQVLDAGLSAYAAGRFAVAADDFRRLADAGSAVGETMLGAMYARGQGVRRDPAAAAGYICRAANRGYAPAQLAFARMLARGEGVAPDRAAAWRWLRRAAERGDPHTVAAARATATRLAAEAPVPPTEPAGDWRPWPGAGD